MRTWQDMLKEDLETMGVDWSDTRDTETRSCQTDGDNSSPDVPLGTGGTKSNSN